MSGIAVVGASDKSFWFNNVAHNLVGYGYTGEIWPVNPNYEAVAGRATFQSLAEVDGELDVVVVAVAAHRCAEIVRAAVARGCRDIVMVSNGFAEAGESGRRLERELVAASAADTHLYGPNCVGFADFRRGICSIAEPITDEVQPGPVSIISQSGAGLSTLMSAVVDDGVGLDWCASLGNASVFDLARAIDYACERETTSVICVYAESLGNDANRLSAALDRARGAGITVAMFKIGRTELSAHIALTHTASIAGDDTLVDAYLRAHGVLRVDSFEELARTAALAPVVRRATRTGGVVFTGSSGGGAALCSELSARDGLQLSQLTPSTIKYLESNAGPGSSIQNPMDLVGKPGARESIIQLYKEVFADDRTSIVVAPWTVVFPDDSLGRGPHRESVERVGRVAEETGTPAIICSATTVPWTEYMLDYRKRFPHVTVVRGMEATIRALSRFFPASTDDDSDSLRTADRPAEATNGALTENNVLGEIRGREELARIEVPLAPGAVAHDVAEAVVAFGQLNPPVVVKLDLAGVSHRAKVGAVTVGCQTEQDVREAITGGLTRAAELGIDPEALTGILIEEMVDGAEVLVGLTRSSLGSFLTVGFGGVAAGRGSVAETVMLPIGPSQIENLCLSVIGRDAVATAGTREAVRAIHTLCENFIDGALSKFDEVEINPLFVSNTAARVADVLLVERI